ncbi:MAG: HD domain-containing protein [Bacteroidia bacterium]
MSWQFPYYAPGERLDWDALEAQFSWLRDMHAVPQDPIWHAEGDVFVHTKMVAEALLNLPEYKSLDLQSQHILLVAALLHDVEKRSTTRTEQIDGVERIVSPRHALKGEYTARSILYQDLVAPFEIREQICKLVRLHGLPLWAIEKPHPAKEVIKATLMVTTQQLALLAKSDILGPISADQE